MAHAQDYPDMALEMDADRIRRGRRPWRRIGALAVIMLAAAVTVRAESQADAPDAGRRLRSLLNAMGGVESGHDPYAVGDGGRAIGVYQIHRAYWQDSGIPGKWEDCLDAAYARRVILGYWTRYCPGALREGNLEILSRVHNGGPRGHKKRTTLSYWRSIQAMTAQDEAGDT